MMKLEWYAFDKLDVGALYALLCLRAQVFVVEQECPYADADGLDPRAYHLLGWDDERTLIACARVFPPEKGRVRVGRIVVAPSQRGNGDGHLLLEEILQFCRGRWPGAPVALAAQAHLTRFYGEHGFVAESEPYDEDGILHVDMVRTLPQVQLSPEPLNGPLR